MATDSHRDAPTPSPADQSVRARFRTSLDRNFSVIAPAGVGKTKSIVDRVVEIATSDPERARDWLPRLVVVTYTNKAADEMHQRARNAIIAAQVGLPVLTQFNRAFFGTIHSFCVRLLRLHGHRCGLPSQFEPVERDDELWSAFIRQLDRLAPDLPSDTVDAVCRLMPLDNLLRLARELQSGSSLPSRDAIPPPPPVSLKGLLDQTARRNSVTTIARAQQAAVAWQQAWARGDAYVPLPRNTSTARDFVASWENAFGPLRNWLARAAMAVAAEIARAYRAYRRTRGALTFADQVDLAWELLRDPETARHLRAERYRIILDEAQDTDPTQFNILLELARPPDASGEWLRDGGAPPEPGRFCMVGDPQQSIYGERADLGWYERVRARLAASTHAEEVAFSVTFRCDRAIIDTVNRLMAPTFERSAGQVHYHPLQPRPGAEDGQVVRWTPETPPEPDRVDATTLNIGRQLAAWLHAQGLDRLRARQWSDVAILCPRTRWLQGLAVGLREKGLGPQIHSERAVLADHPIFAWFTALVHVLSRSDHGFELVGVLREIYGHSDEALAWYAATRESPWALQGKRTPNGRSADPALTNELDAIEATLQALAALADEIDRMPLRDAAERIIQAVALNERLASLDRSDLTIDADLCALVALAAQGEEQSLSLPDFADQLRDKLGETIPARPIIPDAVQLLTVYKAKGLQWPVVILPLFFRAIGEPKTYPALVRAGPGEWPHVALSKDDFRQMQDQVEQKRRQELQRLLYVGLTRAQRTLVITDDHLHFPRKRPNRSFADLVGMIGDDGSLLFSPALNACATEPSGVAASRPTASRPLVAPEPAPPASLIERAIEQVAAAPQRILPYELGEAEAKAERDFTRMDDERTAGAEAARHYGIWWHAQVETMPWTASRDVQEQHWRDALAGCPEPKRGEAEAKLLLDSELAARLREPGLIYRREIPVFWKRDAHSCVEGIVDLAVCQPSRSGWLIVDWKTNVIRPDEREHLRAIYTPQLAAYAAAVFALNQHPVEAGVYSTATGQWIPCVQHA